MAVQLGIPGSTIAEYQQRRQSIVEHGAAVVAYLGLRSFNKGEIQAKQFLQENGILYPADDTLRQLIVTQRQAARNHNFTRIATGLSSSQREKLDGLLVASGNRLTPFQMLKRPPGQPSPKSMLRLAEMLRLYRRQVS